jgi:hypothetical protein
MRYAAVAEGLASEFVNDPVEHVAEFDIQARYYERLRNELRDQRELYAEVTQPNLAEAKSGYKRAYWQSAERKLRSTGRFSRVHTEVSITQGERIDLVVFSGRLDHPIQWVDGSKRFDKRDLDAAFELKFVENESFFPTHVSAASIASLSDEEIRADLDVVENGLQPDLGELKRHPDHVETFSIIYSNKNYLDREPVSSVEREHRPEYARLGRVAREWISDRAGDTDVLYVMPQGHHWLTE